MCGAFARNEYTAMTPNTMDYLKTLDGAEKERAFRGLLEEVLLRHGPNTRAIPLTFSDCAQLGYPVRGESTTVPPMLGDDDVELDEADRAEIRRLSAIRETVDFETLLTMARETA